MPGNRFEQVDEIQQDALNLILTQTFQGQIGAIHVPIAAMTMKLPKPIDSGDMPAKDAFRAAVKLANDMKLAIVVIDKDAIWNAEWGELFRHEDESDAEAASAKGNGAVS
jgi:hypothetical protein